MDKCTSLFISLSVSVIAYCTTVLIMCILELIKPIFEFNTVVSNVSALVLLCTLLLSYVVCRLIKNIK